MLGNEYRKIAQEQLATPIIYTIAYASLSISQIEDSDDVLELLRYEDGDCLEHITESDVRSAIEDATVHITLPVGLMLIGMRHPEAGKEVKTIYGLVDFKAIQ